MERSRLAVLVTVLALNCGGGSATDMASPDLTLSPPFCTDPVPSDGGLAPTFTNVQTLFDRKCLFACHCCGNEVALSAGQAWGNLVNMLPPSTATSGDIRCGGTLVKPNEPAHSYLYQKLTMTLPCFGAQMPLGEFGAVMLPDCEIDLVRRWILAGAPND